MATKKSNGKTPDAGIAKVAVSEYQTVQFMTAAKKQKVARDWELFILKRLKMTDADRQQTEYGALFKGFTKALYDHLNLHCGYIAHYNISGFFGAQFERTVDFLHNMQLIAQGRDGMNMTLARHDYADIGKMMTRVAAHYLPAVIALYRQECNQAHQQDVANARQLLEAEGMTVNG